MKVKVPINIRMGSLPYKIVYNEDILPDDGEQGCAHHHRQEIQIYPRVSLPQKNQNLLHEIGHLIKRQYSCDISEEDIDRIAHGYAEFLFNCMGLEFDWYDIEHPAPSISTVKEFRTVGEAPINEQMYTKNERLNTNNIPESVGSNITTNFPCLYYDNRVCYTGKWCEDCHKWELEAEQLDPILCRFRSQLCQELHLFYNTNCVGCRIFKDYDEKTNGR